MTCQVLKRRDAPDLAYVLRRGAENAPTVVFLSGYRSDMTGSKATALAEWIENTPYHLLRFDYSGHGQSGGAVRDFTISDWVQNAVDICHHVALAGPLILVGSSMGGWIALRLALLHPARIKGLIGIAAAPDFTIHMERALNATDRATLAATGIVEQASTLGPDPYVFTQSFFDDGAANAVLNATHDLAIAMVLLQGDVDPVVPKDAPDHIARAFPNADITIHHIADGDHGLSRPQDLAILYAAIERLAR